MKKFLSLLVSAVLVAALFVPVTASAGITFYRVYLTVTDEVEVTTIPEGWESNGTNEEGDEYCTSTVYPETDLASTYYNQWTADNFDTSSGLTFDGFEEDIEGKTLSEVRYATTNWKGIEKIEVTLPEIEEGQNVLEHPFSFTSTPEESSTGYDTYWFKVTAGEVFSEGTSVAVEAGEVFDKAYDYYLSMVFEACGGNLFTDNTICLVNGVECDCSSEGDELYALCKAVFKAEPTTEAPTTEAPTTEAPTTEDPTTEAPTTEAPTTEAPTTAAADSTVATEAPTTAAASSTATKTGDTMSPMFYVIASIALVAAATVTLFVTRKK